MIYIHPLFYFSLTPCLHERFATYHDHARIPVFLHSFKNSSDCWYLPEETTVLWIGTTITSGLILAMAIMLICSIISQHFMIILCKIAKARTSSLKTPEIQNEESWVKICLQFKRTPKGLSTPFSKASCTFAKYFFRVAVSLSFFYKKDVIEWVYPSTTD